MNAVFLGLTALDWLVVGAYIAGITALGLRSRSAVTSTGDYFMGGRRFGRVLMIAQAFGTGTRADQTVATIGTSYQVGLAGIWVQWLYLFSTPFFWLIAPIYRRLRYVTIGDFFERRYGAGMGAAYACVGLIYFAINIGVMLKGTAVTIEAITGGALSAPAAVAAMVAFFLAYGLAGGLVATVTTDFVQGIFILILSFLVIPFALAAVGGFGGLHDALPAARFDLIAAEQVTLFYVSMAVLNALVGVVVQPHHMAINGAGKTELSCRSGWTYGTFIKRFATLGWALTGLLAAALFPRLSQSDRAFGVAVTELLPAGLVGLMVAALAAAVTGACGAFMVNGSALFTRNFYIRYFRAEAPEAHYLTVARLSSLLVVAGGVGIALYLPTVLQGLELIWRVTAFLGVAFWLGVIWRRANRYGAWASLIVTAGLAFGTAALGWSFPQQVAVYLPLGLASMIVVSRLTRPEPEDRLNAFYSLLHTPVGEEARLREAGIEIVLEGGSEEMTQAKSALFASHAIATPLERAAPSVAAPTEVRRRIPLLDDSPLEARGHGLLLVDLLRLRERFSASRYAVDLRGFGIGWALVAAFLALALIVARIGA